jgi:ABC-type glycerol-3-phosphate transport system permease component
MKHCYARVLLYGAVTALALITFTPLLWLLLASFQDSVFEPLSWRTFEKLTLRHFHQLFFEMPFGRYMMNSFFVAGTVTLVQLFFSSLGGFALARYRFRGQRLVLVVMLATMMIPSQVLLAPLYELIVQLRLADAHLGLIVPGAVSVFGMLLFRQAMLTVPEELLEAARLDGCSEFGVYWHVALPVSRPIIGAFCLIAFMGTWNNFLWPQIVLHSQQLFTLPIGLNQMVGLQQQNYNVVMAGTLLSILPVAVLFFILQKEFIAGLTAGAVKG